VNDMTGIEGILHHILKLKAGVLKPLNISLTGDQLEFSVTKAVEYGLSLNCRTREQEEIKTTIQKELGAAQVAYIVNGKAVEPHTPIKQLFTPAEEKSDSTTIHYMGATIEVNGAVPGGNCRYI